MKKILQTFALIWLCLQADAQNHGYLTEQLKSYIQDFDAEIGIAVCFAGKTFISINNEVHYPLMSVMKFHQAVAALHTLEDRGISLETLLKIKPEDLRKETWSPLRDQYGRKHLQLSIRELLEYTLLLSDNNACDLLYDRVLSPVATERYLQTTGISDFQIHVNEAMMNARPERCYENWSSPSDAVRLLEKVLQGDLLSHGHRTFLLETMMACQTGEKRLPAFPHDSTVRIGHKTGTGSLNSKGEIIGINDLGFVLLPDGRHYTIAVFIKDSKETMEANEQIIGVLSTMVFNFFNQ